MNIAACVLLLSQTVSIKAMNNGWGKVTTGDQSYYLEIVLRNCSLLIGLTAGRQKLAALQILVVFK